MDTPKTPTEEKKAKPTVELKNDFSFRSVWQRFSPILALALVLPIILTLVTSEERFTLFSSADKPPELRLWLEPTSLVTQTNQAVTLSIMAAYEEETKMVPSVSMNILTDPGIVISSSTLSYPAPFRGRTRLGEITLTPTSSGTYNVWIDKNSVSAKLPDGAQILTSPMRLNVRN